ncbi:MAG: hypothetical protein ACYTJ0_08525 [Planctomycetota bacterium]|jgi:hypothetical protein
MNHEQGNVPELPPDDRRALDALVDAGFDLDALDLPPAGRERAVALSRLLELLSDYPVEDADPALIDVTMARIDRAERQRSQRMHVAVGAGAGGGRRLRLPDFVTIAAVLLIAASVILPVMHQLRQRSIDAGCDNNLRYLGYALAQYAADFGNELPVAQAGLNQTWSRFASNVLNLTPLIDEGYCEHGHLRCPGHESGIGSSYGYQWQAPGVRVSWGASRGLVVLGDRNPLIDAVRAGRSVPATALSPNHGGRGQNVLSSDVSTMWLTTPVVGKSDNIWLPDGLDELTDGVRPSRPMDVFLAQ